MIQYLQQSTLDNLVKGDNVQVRQMVNEMSVGLTLDKAISSPKIFAVKKQLGEEILVKILVVVIHTFCHSLKVKEMLDPLEVVNCARVLAGKYTHDSIKDIILALKQAKENGKIFYNAVSEQVIYQIIEEYMDAKSAYLEKQHYDRISEHDGSVRTIAGTIAREHELFEEKMDRINENKKLKQVEQETKELNKVADFIKKNAKNIE